MGDSCCAKVIEGINGTIFAYGPIPGTPAPPPCSLESSWYRILRSDRQWQNLHHHWRQMKPKELLICKYTCYIYNILCLCVCACATGIPLFIAGLVSFQTKQNMTKYSHHMPSWNVVQKQNANTYSFKFQ